MKSWKTTALGIIAVVVAIGNALTAMWDNDPATEPNWGLVASAIVVAVGLLFARDNNVTSEEAGATE